MCHSSFGVEKNPKETIRFPGKCVGETPDFREWWFLLSWLLLKCPLPLSGNTQYSSLCQPGDNCLNCWKVLGLEFSHALCNQLLLLRQRYFILLLFLQHLIQPLFPPHTHCHNEVCFMALLLIDSQKKYFSQDFCCSCLSGCSPKCPFTSSTW